MVGKKLNTTLSVVRIDFVYRSLKKKVKVSGIEI